MSSRQSCNVGTVIVKSCNRYSRSFRKRFSATAPCKSSLVAAMMRTSIRLSCLPPTGRYLRSSIARNSICCISTGRFSTSSRNNVPPRASWKYPGFSSVAPVNAPLTWPKKADAANSLDRLPQSTVMYGLFALRLRLWILPARCSLPVPVLPSMSTVMSVGATRRM